MLCVIEDGREANAEEGGRGWDRIERTERRGKDEREGQEMGSESIQKSLVRHCSAGTHVLTQFLYEFDLRGSSMASTKLLTMIQPRMKLHHQMCVQNRQQNTRNLNNVFINSDTETRVSAQVLGDVVPKTDTLGSQDRDKTIRRSN